MRKNLSGLVSRENMVGANIQQDWNNATFESN